MRSKSLFLFLVLFPLGVLAQENCFNGIDDDGNGLIDLNDTTACVCISNINVGGNESLIPNPSFEDYTCLPSSWSQLNCAQGWSQATNATSDYFNNNGYMPAQVPQPLPDGDGIAGIIIRPGWQEYLGACLNGTMETGENYSITFWVAAAAPNGTFTGSTPIYFGPIELTIFGRPNCVAFPIPTSNCPVPNGWTALGSVTYNPTPAWSQVTLSFTPTFDVNTIILGSPCVLPPDYVQNGPYIPYFFIDDLQLGEDIPFDATIELYNDNGQSINALLCADALELVAHPDSTTGVYQWFHEGIALVGQTDTILHVSADGNGPGMYQFYFEVNDTTCVIAEFEVPEPVYPEPAFSIDPPSGCPTLSVTFTNTTASSLNSICSWDLGNGQTGNTCTVTGTYDTPGLYDVTLTVTVDGCTADTTYLDAVEVVAPPVASFTANETEGCIDLEVQFTNTTATPVQSCEWSFGDGGTANICDPTYIFNIPGTWDVQLTITTPEGCVDDTLMTAYIVSHPPPAVAFTATPDEGCLPVTVQFSNETDPSETSSCSWVFTNGATSTDCDPEVTFDVIGTHGGALTVVSPLGCSATLDLPDIITVYGFPQPTFNVQPPQGCPPLVVTFVNTTPGNPGSICAWDLGNGQTSDNCFTTGTYTTPGFYDVTLTLTSAEGCTKDTTYVQAVEVFEPPVASFTAEETEGCVAFGAQFTNTTSDPVQSCQWEFGDGGTSNSCDPLHVYQTAGIWDVLLTVTSPQGCSDDTLMVGYIQSHDPPVISLTATPPEGCVPLTVQFENTTDPAETGTCAWTFSNGEVSDMCDPVVIFSEVGTYDVGLTVVSPLGCINHLSLTEVVTVHGIPQPDFSAQPLLGCPPLLVNFYNNTPEALTGESLWAFGDGGTANQMHPQYVYQHAGIFDVGLTVISQHGCIGDTVFAQMIEVYELPVAGFTFGPQPTDVFQPMITFQDSSSTDVVEWQWFFGNDPTLGMSQDPDPEFSFPYTEPGTYQVTLVVTNGNGCVDTVMALVVIDGHFSVWVPNSFTPDGDGINEVFMPVILDHIPDRYRLEIFNRWGELIFQSVDPTAGWDGTYNGKLAKQDMYVWQLEAASGVDGLSRQYKGHVTLLR